MFELGRFSSRPCIIGQHRSFSYSEVISEVEKLSIHLPERSLVLCVSENKPEAIIGYICLVQKNHVSLLVDSSNHAERTTQIIDWYRPAFAWAPAGWHIGFPQAEVVTRLGKYALYKFQDAPRAEMHRDLQLLLTTSGSTGSSKFVRISRQNTESNAASIASYLNILSSDVAVTTLPFSYSYGLSIINSHLKAGAAICATELTLLQREFWDLVDRKHVTSLSGVPYTFDMLKRLRFEQRELRSIRYLTQAGGKLSSQGLEYLRAISEMRGWPCYIMYGQTEATARISYLPPKLFAQKLGSIGKPIPGGNLELVNSNEEIITESGVIGELVYIGPNVAMGYALDQADLLRADEWNGRLKTGDLAYRDTDGFYYIAGRLKRILKLFGKRVSLDELENVLLLEYPESQFACHGADEALSIACVGEVDLIAVVKRLAARLAINQTAINAYKLPQIPRTSSGKTDYTALNELRGQL